MYVSVQQQNKNQPASQNLQSILTTEDHVLPNQPTSVPFLFNKEVIHVGQIDDKYIFGPYGL